MGDGGRAIGDGVLQLERLRPAREPDLDEHAARDPVRLVVGESMRALDDESLVDAVGHYATPSSFIARTARASAASVSSMIASVWQVPTSARAPLKSTPFRMSAWRRARLRPASFASRRRQSSWSTA